MIGTKIRQLRMDKGLTLSELAERAGIAKSYLSNIERNLHSNPTFEYIIKIAHALDVDQESLFNEIYSSKEGTDTTKEYFALFRKYIVQMNNKQLEELKDFIEFTIWKRNQN